MQAFIFLLFYDFFALRRCTNRLLPEHKRQESGLSCWGKFKMPGEVWRNFYNIYQITRNWLILAEICFKMHNDAYMELYLSENQNDIAFAMSLNGQKSVSVREKRAEKRRIFAFKPWKKCCK